MLSWIPVNPCERLANPPKGSAASAAGVMSTRAAPARKVPGSAPEELKAHTPSNRMLATIRNESECFMQSSPNLNWKYSSNHRRGGANAGYQRKKRYGSSHSSGASRYRPSSQRRSLALAGAEKRANSGDHDV